MKMCFHHVRFPSLALGILVVFFLLRAGIASDGKIAATITWSGLSIEKASFWINHEPCGTGRNGYERVIDVIKKLPEGSLIVVQPYRAHYVELVETYSRVDDMPFADDAVARRAFEDLLFGRQIQRRVILLDSVEKLPSQHKR